jgi:hypothetical protein
MTASGERFGKFVIVEFVRKDKHSHEVWRVKCDCGTVEERRVSHLRHEARQGHVSACKACGLKRRARLAKEARNRIKRTAKFFA